MLQETPDIDTLSEPELRALASRLMGRLQHPRMPCWRS